MLCGVADIIEEYEGVFCDLEIPTMIKQCLFPVSRNVRSAPDRDWHSYNAAGAQQVTNRPAISDWTSP